MLSRRRRQSPSGSTGGLGELEVRIHDGTLDAVVACLGERLEDGPGHAVTEFDEVTTLGRGAVGEDGFGEMSLRCLGWDFPACAAVASRLVSSQTIRP
jgi:hypothetical protein